MGLGPERFLFDLPQETFWFLESGCCLEEGSA